MIFWTIVLLTLHIAFFKGRKSMNGLFYDAGKLSVAMQNGEYINKEKDAWIFIKMVALLILSATISIVQLVYLSAALTIPSATLISMILLAIYLVSVFKAFSNTRESTDLKTEIGRINYFHKFNPDKSVTKKQLFSFVLWFVYYVYMLLVLI